MSKAKSPGRRRLSSAEAKGEGSERSVRSEESQYAAEHNNKSGGSKSGGGDALFLPSPRPRDDPSPPSSSSVALWSIRGRLYDLSSFLDRHPGGRLILEQARGLDDATPLFESYHAFSDLDSITKMMAKFDRGKAPAGLGELYSFSDDGFYRTCQREVRATIISELGRDCLSEKTYKAGAAFWVKSFVTMALWIATYSLAFSFPSLVEGWITAAMGSCSTLTLTLTRCTLAGISGTAFIMIGLQTMHDASHYALFKDPANNQAAMNWWCGAALWNGTLWHAHHVVRHHAYTGDPRRDPDTFHIRPFLRKHPKHSPKKTVLTDRYEKAGWVLPSLTLGIMFALPGMWLGQTLVYSIFWPLRGRMWGMPSISRDRSTLPCAVLGLAFIATQYLGGSWLATLAYVVGMNATYAVCIFPDHDTHSTMLNELGERREGDPLHDWGEVQVRNSGNFSGKFFSACFGGINYQIEHHLFPTLHHGYLPLVAKTVRRVCDERGVPYVHHDSVTAAVVDFLWKIDSLNGKSAKGDEKKKKRS